VRRNNHVHQFRSFLESWSGSMTWCCRIKADRIECSRLNLAARNWLPGRITGLGNLNCAKIAWNRKCRRFESCSMRLLLCCNADQWFTISETPRLQNQDRAWENNPDPRR
jgi:hypothetical protein